MAVPTAALTLGMMGVTYLLGSIPFSYLVARSCGVDLRTVGSGNLGGANVWRACGFGPFLVAITGDILKGMLPTLAALYALRLPPSAVVLVGVAAIIGHTLSIFMGFKGGKAVATSGGVLLAILPLLVLAGGVAWVGAFLVTRISSIGSLSAAIVVFLIGSALYIMGDIPLSYAVFIWVAFVLIVYLHRENIQRLMNGTENRFKRLS